MMLSVFTLFNSKNDLSKIFATIFCTRETIRNELRLEIVSKCSNKDEIRIEINNTYIDPLRSPYMY